MLLVCAKSIEPFKRHIGYTMTSTREMSRGKFYLKRDTVSPHNISLLKCLSKASLAPYIVSISLGRVQLAC